MLSDYVWKDTNNNGAQVCCARSLDRGAVLIASSQDSGEPPIAGVVLQLLDSSSVLVR